MQLNRAIADAVRGTAGLHQKGFSYLQGHHCVRFANELTAALQPLASEDGACAFGVLPVDQLRAQAPRTAACFDKTRASPRLGAYLRRVGFGEAVSPFEHAEKAVKLQQSRMVRVRVAVEKLIDPGDCWLPKRGSRASRNTGKASGQPRSPSTF